jgi:hypothetical protein
MSLYLMLTGSFTQALILFVCGFFIYPMVDNIVRPILVGRDTKIPIPCLPLDLCGLALFVSTASDWPAGHGLVHGHLEQLAEMNDADLRKRG